MKTLTLSLTLLVLLFSVSCGGSHIVREYCDPYVSYTVVKLGEDYRLYLHAGKVSPNACRMPHAMRTINLQTDIKTVEEAVRMAEGHREMFKANPTKPSEQP